METKKIRLAINGFGRIGRVLFRQVCGDPRFDIVAINDLSDVENLAYLLKYDTVYGNYKKNIKVITEGTQSYLEVDGDKFLVLKEADPKNLPWKDLKVDVVAEATGIFDSFAKARAHINAGAKKIVITSPVKEDDMEDAKTVLMGVNEAALKTCVISSNGSCTTNASHPAAIILSEKLGVEKALLTTTHAYTATQNLVDGISHSKTDMRRGRAAAMNMVPARSGAAISVGKVVKALEGKFDALAIRVPVVTVSLADLTFVTSKNTTVAEVNQLFKDAAKEERFKGVFDVTEDQVVSSDMIGMNAGCVIDLSLTRVVGGNLVKVLAWYDNEWGYVSTLVNHITKTASHL